MDVIVKMVEHRHESDNVDAMLVQRKSIPCKGDCFWYKAKNKIYGAVVLDVQPNYCSYYLIAISEELEDVPPNVSAILSSKIYTVAWFTTISLLAERRMHLIGKIEVNQSYNNKLGLHITPQKSVILSNCGQKRTWTHQFRSLAYSNTLIKEVI